MMFGSLNQNYILSNSRMECERSATKHWAIIPVKQDKYIIRLSSECTYNPDVMCPGDGADRVAARGHQVPTERAVPRCAGVRQPAHVSARYCSINETYFVLFLTKQ